MGSLDDKQTPDDYYKDKTGTHPVFWPNADDVNIADAGGRYTATEVETALQEIAGSGRTTETVKGTYDAAVLKTGAQTMAGPLTITNSLTINGASRVRAKQSSGQSITDASVTVIQYDTEDFDNLSEWDAVTNYRFAPGVTGYYWVAAAFLTASVAWTTGDSVVLRIQKNGATYSDIFYARVQANFTNYFGAQGSDLIYLTDSDYIDIAAYISRGAATSLHNNAQYNFVSIHRLS